MQYLNVSVATLLSQHPWAQEVLDWYGVEVEDADRCLSLSALCWLKRLDPERLVRDLAAAHPDVADEGFQEFLRDGVERSGLWVDDEELEADNDLWDQSWEGAWRIA